MQSAVELVREEHVEISSKLDELEMALVPIKLATIKSVIIYLEGHLPLHRKREDEILNPFIGNRCPVSRVAIQALAHEYEYERQYLKGAASVIQGPESDTVNLGQLVELCRGLIRFLRDHMRKEEDLILKVGGPLLTAEENAQLLVRLQAVK